MILQILSITGDSDTELTITIKGLVSVSAISYPSQEEVQPELRFQKSSKFPVSRRRFVSLTKIQKSQA
ncbi:hypothetical protein L1987_57410 [Smallanthus sonchifolius]|uniref:Uncharacterized protein n=1 Tax=Smallanthus sonchifolius TaxID=185202 RepID=A0ACB9DCX8_9ASTR|nr:hypothetical protein L1987_57410 [Smallanthus sonchifolius]